MAGKSKIVQEGMGALSNLIDEIEALKEILSVGSKESSVQPTTVKRASDFKETGNYDVTLPDGTTELIFRDTDQFGEPYWYKTGQNQTLGQTREQAVSSLEKNMPAQDPSLEEMSGFIDKYLLSGANADGLGKLIDQSGKSDLISPLLKELESKGIRKPEIAKIFYDSDVYVPSDEAAAVYRDVIKKAPE